MRIPVRYFPLLPALCLAACSGTGSESPAAGSGNPVVANQRIKSGEMGDDDYGKIAERFGSFSPFATDSKGNPMGLAKGASEFDRANSQFQGGYNGKTYQANEYKKTSWWGDRDYVKKVYGGDTDANDLRRPSRFDGNAAGEGSQVARDSGRTYRTGEYGTGAASEAGTKRLAKTTDAQTESRRDTLGDPDIIPWQQHHEVTLDQTRSRLGR